MIIQSYVGNDPQRGDIVAYHPPTAPDAIAISRVIALPGDTIQITAAGVLLNGKKLDESYAEGDNLLASGPLASTTIAPGHYFLLYDNRSSAADSRAFGPVTRASIDGKMVLVLG